MKIKQLTEFARRLSPITDGTYKLWLNAIGPIENEEATTLESSRVTEYRMQMLQPWGPWAEGTLRSRLQTLTAIWNVGIEAKWLTENPWRGAHKRYTKSRRKYSQKNFDTYSTLHNDAMFLCYWYHGFRLGELAGLQTDEIILNDNIPHFDLKHNKLRRLKNDASIRQVPIHPACLQVVKQLPEFKKTTSWSPGDKWSQMLYRRVGHRAHALRHNFINRMRKAGIEYSIAMSLVGHEAHGQTADYGEITLEDKLQELKKLSQ